MPTSTPSARERDGLIAEPDGGREPAASLTSPSLLLTRHIKAPPDRVFAAWTDPARISQWFVPVECAACRAEADVRVGGRFRIVMNEVGGEVHDVSGVYRVVAPPTLLVFTWAWRSTPERESLVTLHFRPDGEGTMLTLIHEHFFNEAARDGHEKGWSVILDKLQNWFASILGNASDREVTMDESGQTRHDAGLNQHKVVGREEWIAARKALLAREKMHSRAGDELSRQRRALPWVKVEKDYVFDAPDGQKSLGDLFDGHSQLIVYHFMFAPGWTDGCVGCSFIADHMDGANLHLAHHDVKLLAVSRAELSEFIPFKERMGWSFDWVSSAKSDFNYDFHVSATPDEIASGQTTYNYETSKPGPDGELHGISVFTKTATGEIFHTYSSYGRGGDHLIGAHNFLDLTPKGRNEDGVMNWVRLHDRYEDAAKPQPEMPPMASCCG